MIVLNLKTYPEATGSAFVETFAAVGSLMRRYPDLADDLLLVPQLPDLAIAKSMTEGTKARIAAPHFDAIESGRGTGHVPGERLLDLGIEYSLLNHSEHRLGEMGEVVSACEWAKDKGLNVIACAQDLAEAKALSDIDVFAIAYEPPDLIGGEVSVSEGKTEQVREFVEIVTEPTKAFIGAGVNDMADIAEGRKLNADGFLLASAFAKTENKYDKLVELYTPYIDNINN